jgi:hypothetical protein
VSAGKEGSPSDSQSSINSSPWEAENITLVSQIKKIYASHNNRSPQLQSQCALLEKYSNAYASAQLNLKLLQE